MKHKLLAVALAALALTVMNSCTSNTNTADAVFVTDRAQLDAMAEIGRW